MTFLPEIAQYPAPPQVLIRGKIIYEGSPEYLPGTVGEARDNVDARIVVKYTLDESRTRADHVAVDSDTYKFKMWSASGGTHIGEKGWNIAATLEVLDRDKLIKGYTALAFAEGDGQFGDTLTEMRKKPS